MNTFAPLARLSVLSVCILHCGTTSIALAQDDTEKAAITRNQQQLRINFDKLTGKVENLEAKVDLIAKSGLANPELIRLIGPLADYYSGVEGNQKEELFKAIVEFACRYNHDSCELKWQIAQLERRINRLEEVGPEPSQVLPSPIAPYYERPPQLEPPVDDLWDGTIDFITGRRSSFCKSAIRVARCIDYQVLDGSIYHGNVYRTCQGNVVLLVHTRTRPYQSIASIR